MLGYNKKEREPTSQISEGSALVSLGHEISEAVPRP